MDNGVYSGYYITEGILYKSKISLVTSVLENATQIDIGWIYLLKNESFLTYRI
ncbi:hypothetical protein Curi_c11280 [Gottschalkia acidurici 9a]|uniref:Uncharacterized protein n=1 Tax=Gottschalkia acidurici (strain ATCC 7906 / DSM 604 / BCRC 14475 / CIP 104303 / KCTC 5404 / NCIMB 10678 / 9a) TaxID=1128398 RepID=K0AZC7_GOTA9|nr:hypothetical protein Curi_c11280 [Gottschalkia acidurici 9a]